MDSPSLRTLNDSGFPLQVAIQRQVEATQQNHGWRVLYAEHAWASKDDQRSGFVDLLLTNAHGTAFIALECKRPRDTEWVFIHSDGRPPRNARVQAWISHYSAGQIRTFGWCQISVDPVCHEVQFCALRGQSTAERVTLIEKAAAELVLATECIANEHRDYRAANFDDLKIFCTVIVTTAKLTVATFDPGAISLSDGTLSNAEFLEVPYVRLRKQLGVQPFMLTPQLYESGVDVASLKESTVYVVQAAAFSSFLSDFEVRDRSLQSYLGAA